MARGSPRGIGIVELKDSTILFFLSRFSRVRSVYISLRLYYNRSIILYLTSYLSRLRIHIQLQPSIRVNLQRFTLSILLMKLKLNGLQSFKFMI